MATVVRLQPAGGNPAAWVVAKGAPEVMAQFLSDAPPDYEDSYKAHAAQGSRCVRADCILPVGYTVTRLHILCVWAEKPHSNLRVALFGGASSHAE